MINTSLHFLGGQIYSLYLPANTAFSQEILNSILAVTGNEKNCDSLGHTTLVEGSTTPVEGDTTPVEGSTTPVEGDTTPVEGDTIPVEGHTTSVKGNTREQRYKLRHVEVFLTY